MSVELLTDEGAFWLRGVRTDPGSYVPKGVRDELTERGLISSAANITRRGERALARLGGDDDAR